MASDGFLTIADGKHLRKGSPGLALGVYKGQSQPREARVGYRRAGGCAYKRSPNGLGILWGWC